jgi:hypothetical protein
VNTGIAGVNTGIARREHDGRWAERIKRETLT